MFISQGVFFFSLEIKKKKPKHTVYAIPSMIKLFPTGVENIVFCVIHQNIFKMTVVGVVFQRDYRTKK